MTVAGSRPVRGVLCTDSSVNANCESAGEPDWLTRVF